MPKPIIVGEAPVSRDGTPFTGRSGKTLMTWAGVSNRHELAEYFDLDNFVQKSLMPAKPGQPKNFPMKVAPVLRQQFEDRHESALIRELGTDGALEYLLNQRRTVLVMSSLVWGAFDLPRPTKLFEAKPYKMRYMMIRFPHPSGLNRQLNDPDIVREAIRHLRLIGGLPLAESGQSPD